MSKQGVTKLFGVEISPPAPVVSDDGDDRLRKSKSLGNLAVGSSADQPCYLSDDMIYKCATKRKTGIPWTDKEHRLFLRGLRICGKGEWKAIAERYVLTRTSSQVASHAQKHFYRLAAEKKKNRRASIFDVQPLPEEEELFEAEAAAKAEAGSSTKVKPAEIPKKRKRASSTDSVAPVKRNLVLPEKSKVDAPVKSTAQVTPPAHFLPSAVAAASAPNDAAPASAPNSAAVAAAPNRSAVAFVPKPPRYPIPFTRPVVPEYYNNMALMQQRAPPMFASVPSQGPFPTLAHVKVYDYPDFRCFVTTPVHPNFIHASQQPIGSFTAGMYPRNTHMMK